MRQKLGQHFLINKSAIKKIIASLELQSGDAIIEIGPGQGALTFPLLQECKKIGCRIVAIEKDQNLASSLELLAFRKNFKSEIKIIKDDVLKILPELTKSYQLSAKSYKLVGNIPYYITGNLLRTISEIENKPELAVLMIQKEVAERISTKQGDMNLLAAATQVWADPKILFTLPPKDFDPAPAVHSAVIQLRTKNEALEPKELEKYYKLIHIIFKQPRKMLFNNLREGLDIPKERIESALAELRIDLNARPQNLSVEQIKELSEILF